MGRTCVAKALVAAAAAWATVGAFPESPTEGVCAAASQEGPSWKMLTLLLKATDVTVDGRRVQTSMARTGRLEQARAAARGVPALFARYSDGVGRATMTVVEVDEPLRSLSLVDSKKPEKGYLITPRDVDKLLDKHAPKGRFDSIFMLWEPGVGKGAVPVTAAWGRGPGDDSHGMTFANVYPDTGPEGMVHEWLHGAGAYYRDRRLDVPDPHDNRIYGFPKADAKGSWGAWYTALMRGQLWREGTRVGYRQTVWASGTPTKPQKPGIVTNATLAPKAPDILQAEVQGNDWVYLAWRPSPGVSHFTRFITVKKPDGRFGDAVSAFETGSYDRGDFNYVYARRDDVCRAAARSGVRGLVSLHAQVWANRDSSIRDDATVKGQLRCP